GNEWTPVIPVLVPLTLYGALTTVGGIFGPLYRAFGIMRAAFGIKLLTLVLVLPVGIVLMQSLSLNIDPFWGWSHFDLSATRAAIGGAWTINVLFLVSIALTMAITLPLLRRKAMASDLQAKR